MSYRDRCKTDAINERARKRSEEHLRRFNTRDYISLDELNDELDKKYNTITLRANFKYTNENGK